MKEWLEGEELSEELRKGNYFLRQEVKPCDSNWSSVVLYCDGLL